MLIEYQMDSAEKVFANHNLMMSCVPESALNDQAYTNYTQEILERDYHDKLSIEMRAALAQLTDKQRKALILSACYGLTHEKIAVQMNCGRRSVTYHVNAAKAKIKKILVK